MAIIFTLICYLVFKKQSRQIYLYIWGLVLIVVFLLVGKFSFSIFYFTLSFPPHFTLPLFLQNFEFRNRTGKPLTLTVVPEKSQECEWQNLVEGGQARKQLYHFNGAQCLLTRMVCKMRKVRCSRETA